MPLPILLIWILAVSTVTLAGSWYARRFGRADLLVALYVTFVLVAQVLAAKIGVVDLGFRTFYVPAGVLVFSVTFLLTDIVNERFGRRETHRMIFTAFVTQVAMVLFFWLGVAFPPAPFWPDQEIWAKIFLAVPRITLASWAAFLVSENLDAVIYAWFRKITGGRRLWMRNVLSTIPALTVDSLIFAPLAFLGVTPVIPIMVGQLVIKWIIGIINIPFMYLNRAVLGEAPASDRKP